MLLLKFVALVVFAPGFLLAGLWLIALVLACTAAFWLLFLHMVVCVLEARTARGRRSA